MRIFFTLYGISKSHTKVRTALNEVTLSEDPLYSIMVKINIWSINLNIVFFKGPILPVFFWRMGPQKNAVLRLIDQILPKIYPILTITVKHNGVVLFSLLKSWVFLQNGTLEKCCVKVNKPDLTQHLSNFNHNGVGKLLPTIVFLEELEIFKKT